MSKEEPPMMGFVEKLSHPKVRSIAEQWLLSGAVRSPAVIEIDPTTACNYQCPECISAGLLNSGEMTAECLTRLLEHLASNGAAAVVFIGGGEPLAHSSMPGPLHTAKNLGLRVGLTTNGYFIGRHLQSIAEQVAWTRVSMDAGTAETYRAFRPNRDANAFERVLEHMRRLNTVKRGKVGYSFLLLSRLGGASNYGEIFEAARLAKDTGCDYFELKPSVDLSHSLIPWSSTERQLVVQQLTALDDLRDDSFEIVLANSLEYLLEGKTSQPKTYKRCPSVELRTVVTPQQMYACPYKRGNPSAGWRFDGEFGANWAEGAAVRASIDPSRDCPFYCIRDTFNRALLHGDLGTNLRESDDPFI